DEAGRDRAAFIRLQCELASLAPDAPGRDELPDREAELLRLRHASWLAPFPACVRSARHRFERGFLAHVELTVSQLLKQAGSVFRRTPLTSLCLTKLQEKLPEVVACPHLAGLRTLELILQGQQRYNPAGLLAAAPTLANLRALQVSHCQMRSSGLSELLAS